MTVTDIAPTYATGPVPDEVDVLVVGAGISGIGMGRYLTVDSPGSSFAIVDSRDAIGGTWDLFTYPGIRSDSDLYTFAYEFKPWTARNCIADAHEILDYLHEVVAENGLADTIHLGWTVTSASWSSESAQWTVGLRNGAGETRSVRAGWLFGATGYYDYDAGYLPEWEGVADYHGTLVHPQAWPDDLDYAGKKVVVIGSGATAVTLIPAMAEQVERITMLQRSPSYVLPYFKSDPIALAGFKLLPEKLAYRLARRSNVWRHQASYKWAQKHPTAARKVLRALAKARLPKTFDVDTHFRPTYNVWDQRLCVVPNGDLFTAIRSGKADIVTDHIDRFTATGIRTTSGRELEADIVVTATGLRLKAFGGMALTVDGETVQPSEQTIFRSTMLSGVPNFSFAFGYTNSSWTLKVDLVCEYTCKLLEHLRATGADLVVPQVDDRVGETAPMLGLTSGYVSRSIDQFPKQGSGGPWTVEQDFYVDEQRLRKGPVTDPALHFARAAEQDEALAG